MTTTQLSMFPALVPNNEQETNDETIPTEAEWGDLLRPATVPLESVRQENGEWHTCGTKFVADKAQTSEGAQAIVICFGCNVYWRTGHNDESLMSVVKLIRCARSYWKATHPKEGKE